jgi:hypothetical protein
MKTRHLVSLLLLFVAVSFFVLACATEKESQQSDSQGSSGSGTKDDASSNEPEKPDAEKPAPAKPAAEEPAPVKPAVEEPAPVKPAVEEPAPEKPAVEEPAPEKPAAGLTTQTFDKEMALKYPDIAKIYKSTLHYTGEGMRSFYNAKDGFSSMTGIPYDRLGCKKCHATTCLKCHGGKKDGALSFSTEKAKEKATCLQCHVRAGAMINLDKKTGVKDVHAECGMQCSQCHKIHPAKEQSFVSMRQPGAMKAACENCHKEGGTAPAPDVKIKGHKKHLKKLHCNACHVSNTISCYNCHFDEFLRTKKKKGNFLAPVKANVFLLNYQGKVTSGNIQTLVSKGRKFIAYAPYFTHSIRAKGRACNECHGVEAAVLLKAGKKLPVMTYENGKVVMRKGIIPVFPDLLQFLFFDKKDGEWVLIENDEKPAVQFVGYGEPLTLKQIKRLASKFK